MANGAVSFAARAEPDTRGVVPQDTSASLLDLYGCFIFRRMQQTVFAIYMNLCQEFFDVFLDHVSCYRDSNQCQEIYDLRISMMAMIPELGVEGMAARTSGSST